MQDNLTLEQVRIIIKVFQPTRIQGAFVQWVVGDMELEFHARSGSYTLWHKFGSTCKSKMFLASEVY